MAGISASIEGIAISFLRFPYKKMFYGQSLLNILIFPFLIHTELIMSCATI